MPSAVNRFIYRLSVPMLSSVVFAANSPVSVSCSSVSHHQSVDLIISASSYLSVQRCLHQYRYHTGYRHMLWFCLPINRHLYLYLYLYREILRRLMDILFMGIVEGEFFKLPQGRLSVVEACQPVNLLAATNARMACQPAKDDPIG